MGESPRTGGRNEEHVARLAELDGPLPPILVERQTMRVIDGTHRLLAAVSKGLSAIEVEFFDGSSADAFLKAVEANVTHGLPLSLADRRAAAERIVTSHPNLSDRTIARTAGLGARAVAAIRRRVAETADQPQVRVGRDGKVRPLNRLEGRRRAAELIAERPGASLREVARLAGISPATVSDVRRRLAAGEAPATGAASDGTVSVVFPNQRTRATATRRIRLVRSDPAMVLEKLLRDPSLRHKEEGRQLLRLFQQNAMGLKEWSELTAVVPTHCTALVVDLTRQFAETWLEFAQQLDQRVRVVDRAATG
ncbi:helix-turn-helix domain-containing protein [Kitasatospora sp. RB6PN24]|uniref:helix-turn-helix domain-containing protein n=1 Tax=Kitasatospora humi TaxID=2893891 RepID=UPI001E48D6DD|nr:helix-turn-helix domain-containing protein [Kitasatospora humi]MCC9311907.1 helix-turn-helix domain-containing protein [Kitasatospora humi]